MQPEIKQKSNFEVFMLASYSIYEKLKTFWFVHYLHLYDL